MKCLNCGIISTKPALTNKTFKNGTKHIEARCEHCGNWLRWMAQNLENYKEFNMPIGKYKGKRIKDFINDIGYLKWGIEIFSGALKTRFEAALKCSN